jgi:hypothetical protein
MNAKTQPAAKSESKPIPAKTEPTKPTQPVDNVAGPAAGVKANRFVRSLEVQVASYVAAQKLAKVPDDLGTFLGWCKANPPADKVSAPAGDSATGKIWAHCDAAKASGKAFTRKDVIDALVAQGLNKATISTQYQRWTKARAVAA